MFSRGRIVSLTAATSTVEKRRVRPRRPASLSWRVFLKNHLTELVALDFFPVPTVGFTLLFVLIVLARERRTVVHCAVTAQPTAHWTVQPIVEGFPWDTSPK